MRRTALIAIAFALAGIPRASVAQERIGSFVLVQQRDPVTDRNRTFAYTTAVDAGYLETAILAWRCDGNRFELFVKAAEYLDDDDVIVQWRFDSQPPSDRRLWNPSTNGTGAFAPPDDIEMFTAGAIPAREVVVRLWDYRYNAVTYRFRLDGLVASLRRLPCVPTSTS